MTSFSASGILLREILSICLRSSVDVGGLFDRSACCGQISLGGGSVSLRLSSGSDRDIDMSVLGTLGAGFFSLLLVALVLVPGFGPDDRCLRLRNF